MLGLWEFYSLFETKKIHPQKIFGLFIGALLFIIFAFAGLKHIHQAFFLIVPLWLTIFIYELLRKDEFSQSIENPFENIVTTILGHIYIIFPFNFILFFGSFSEKSGSFADIYNHELIFGFFFLVWANDTFAYLVGVAIGRTKLFERISPKKTWEGTIGGVFCTQGIAYVISIYFTGFAPVHWHAVALIVSVFGTLGDLVESMFKRSLGVKDSGTILPGHGGILDRFDGVLLAAPFVMAYLLLFR
jgi:phosphatidate cytidylyltransferase